MSAPPTVPAANDVFSDPIHPSPPASRGHTATASSQDKRSLVAASLSWFSLSGGLRGPGEALESVREDDEQSEVGMRSRDKSEAVGSNSYHPGFDSPPPTPVPQHRKAVHTSPAMIKTPSHSLWFLRSGNDIQQASLSTHSPPDPPRFASTAGILNKTRLTRLDEDPLLGSPSKPPPRQTASSPTTPLRPGQLATTFGPPRASPAKAGEAAAWTWPARQAAHQVNHAPSEAVVDSPRNSNQGWGWSPSEATPTKLSGQAAPLIASPPKLSKSVKDDEVATRYVLIRHLDRDLSEQDLRETILCEGLSLRGCFTAFLRAVGQIVLVFHDVRDALTAVRNFKLRFNLSRSVFEQFFTVAEARCITRDSFEELAGQDPSNPLLSKSEGVLVFTLRGPTSTPYFTPLPLLASLGEIRALKVVEEHLHVVEYWDDRAAQTACQRLDGKHVGGARFGCSFEPAVASLDLPDWAELTDDVPHNSASPVDSFFTPPVVQSSAPVSAASPSGRTTVSVPPTPAQTPFTPFVPHAPFSSGIKPFSRPASAGLAAASMSGMVYQSTPSPLPTFQRYSPAPSPVAQPPSCAHQAEYDTPPHKKATPPLPRLDGKSRVGRDFGIVRDDKIPSGNVLVFERIERGIDMRTTLMIKNIPNKMKDYEVMGFIDEVAGRSYDFFYLRCDYSNGYNVGYGFVNFTSTTALLQFAKARLGTRWNKCGSDKLCVMSYANIQGKASLIAHFKNSSVLDQDESRRPKLFVSSACDDPVRKARSAMNASNVGLFPSHKPVFKVAKAFKGLQISDEP
ncbi:meiosis protein Mei2 [Rhodotorula toruloides]|uniref:Meiosis protein Mei2 n=1 Tax=Rhodotorula toruloides TaxID=5286 RepID=A0A511KKY4_RHOTO|nr:meiosis protein Mei2 [Rhodotorula toruloides]